MVIWGDFPRYFSTILESCELVIVLPRLHLTRAIMYCLNYDNANKNAVLQKQLAMNKQMTCDFNRCFHRHKKKTLVYSELKILVLVKLYL